MGAPAPRWAALVVNFESGPLLLDCVRSLLADTSAGPPEVVVADNGSADGSAAALRAALPDIDVVTPPGDVTNAAAANRYTAATPAAGDPARNPALPVP